MTTIQLPYGQNVVSLDIPTDHVSEIIHPQPVPASENQLGVVKEAFENPIGSRRLRDVVKPGQSVAVIVDDFTRKTPTARILPLILETLHDAGVKEKDIRIVIALGTHRPMTEEELRDKLGSRVVASYAIVNRPSTSDDDMVFLGTSSNGIPAWVNRSVAEADVRIGVGMITPHMEAGFTGGSKIVLPGVCSSLTVGEFHKAGIMIPHNQLGNLESPLRRNLESFVAEQVPLDFIVNVVTTHSGEIFQCVAGHPVSAHRVGVEYCRRVYGAAFRHRYPIVLANCHPYDVDLWQSTKGAFCGDLVTEDGGVLILLTRAPEGNSNYPLVPSCAGQPVAKTMQEVLNGTAADLKQAVTGIQFASLRERLRLVLVSDGLAAEDAESMRIEYAESLQDAVMNAIRSLPRSRHRGSFAVILCAGTTLPVPIGS
jgi:nickel-dependent lactate racemase